MLRPLFFFASVGIALIVSSAHAACGGGGYKHSTEESTREVRTQREIPAAYQEVQSSSASPVMHSSRLDVLRRDVENAQAKLDDCTGDCEKERRKLAEAQARLARDSSDYSK